MSAFADSSCRTPSLCTQAAVEPPKPAPVHVTLPVLGQSAQSDFVPFQRRIHSLRLGDGLTGSDPQSA
ncbi:hypothetical protein, partial [Longimicrobium sp.]|uniref:hypothetical protein n=1 Tax=Longimicrobium sp. TaxID=2029185 RepID=UPI002E31246F